MAADFVSGSRRSFMIWSAILPLGVMIMLGLHGVLAALLGMSAAGMVVWLAKLRIGGVTGDVFGAIVEIVESTVLLIFLVRL
jgi:adenosylcobinamide-GDP ribazoletransferase